MEQPHSWLFKVGKRDCSFWNVPDDTGIRHFDTAPYYGYGEAERVLGEFLREKRDHVTVTTKFGIQPPSVMRNPIVNQLARKILGLAPSLRSILSKNAQNLSKTASFSAEAARKSLEQSLKSLRTDRIDLYLLHEPSLTDAASPEIHDFLQERFDEARFWPMDAVESFQRFVRLP